MTKPCDFNAASIYKLLEAKHCKDVIIPECKDGPTHGVRHSRLDAWTMARSWAHPLMTGYEIKISRSDFLQDRKWTNYLCLCNEFYFVCPWGLIGVHEVPDDAGLMWVSKNLSRVYTKKKAPYRNIEPPTALMTYLIMNYCSTSCNIGTKNTANREYWANWLNEKKLDRDLGYRVGAALNQKI
ncbi:MAG: MmcB family DNA repair protein, partial [Planctomycetota bacterium]